MLKRIINLAIVAMVVATVSVMAAPNQGMSDSERVALRAYQTEMQNFNKTEVFPKLIEIQKNFDQSISKNDLETLNNLRTNMRAERMEKRKENKGQGNNPQGNNPQGNSMKPGNVAPNPDNAAELNKIIKNNPKQYDKLKSDLQKLQQEVQPKLDELNKNLLEKYPILKNRPNLGKNSMINTFVQSPDKFLLWNPTPNKMMGPNKPANAPDNNMKNK
ncbi:MAG TPA: hypothetical protein P5545_01685 [Bacteroidota bacterium]|nr:hypothetical protein [Candidatus Kapabacteria bacterium]HRS01242.1 hypothetical protein [Bacteroidota bacterium]